MGTRSVRLDEESENVLDVATKLSGSSISDVIKHGLQLVQKEINQNRNAIEFFDSFDIGEGGEALGDARDASQLIKQKLRNAKR